MKITVREIADAIEKNGYPHIKNNYITRDKITYEVLGACALGQAALNLGVDVDVVDSLPFAVEVISLNDDKGWSLKDIAHYLRESYASNLDEIVYNDEEFINSDY